MTVDTSLGVSRNRKLSKIATQTNKTEYNDALVLWDMLSEFERLMKEMLNLDLSVGGETHTERDFNRWSKTLIKKVNELIKLVQACIKITNRDIRFDSKAKHYIKKYRNEMSKIWSSKFEQLIQEDEQLNMILKQDVK